MKNLMVVEDEKLIRKGIVAIASRAGIEIENIIECKNGAEALEVLREQKVDVMITDIRMPKMDGITLVNEIQKLKHIPKVIVISGYDDFSYAVDMLRCGVKEYLLKPINREDITKILLKMNSEILEEEQKSEVKIKTVYNQIRYVLMHEDLEESERKLIYNQAVEGIGDKPYVIICTNYHVNRKIISKEICYFPDILGHNLIMIDPELAMRFIEEEIPTDQVGISRIYESIEQLREAFQEAVAMRKRLFCLCRASSEGRKEEEVPAKDIDKCIQLIGTSRLEETDRFLINLIQMTRNGELSADTFSRLMQQIVSKLMHTYASVIAAEGIPVRLLLNVYNYTDINEYYVQLSKIIGMINRKVSSDFDDYRNQVKMKQAVKYIEENYHRDINMAMVSNDISMNYSVFSITFKEYTGQNFVSYLKSVRLKEAKRLLDETDYKVNEISQKVGYEDEKHFMKTFKMTYGITPSEYRKNLLMGKQIKE